MPRRSAAAILSVPMSKPRYTAVESQLMISPSYRSASASASALLPVAVGPSTATANRLLTTLHAAARKPRKHADPLPHAQQDIDGERDEQNHEAELLRPR